MSEEIMSCLQRIAIGALLHDIGKPVQRQGGCSGRHSTIGYEFLRERGITDPDILDQVRFHHVQEMKNGNYSELCYITCLADNIAAGTDRREIEDGSPGFDSKSPLASVFNLLNNKSQTHYHSPGMLREGKINMPQTDKSPFDGSSYKEIVGRIGDNLKQFQLSYDYLNSLLEIFEATLSFVPSSTSTNEAADISLYDHAKLTAAIACSLYLYLQENGITDYEDVLFKQEKSFRDAEFAAICSVDVSGIQDFIYTIHSKNALKTLRGRSFYLEIFVENLIDNILCAQSLSRANLLYSGGGHFYLLLPNTSKALDSVRQTIGKTNAWLLKTFDTALYVAEGFSPCSYNSLINEPRGAYREIFARASDMISSKKLRRYEMQDIVHLNEKHQSGRECRICYKVNQNGDECEFCSDMISFSPQIVSKDFFAVVDQYEHSSIPLMEGQYLVAQNEVELRKRLKQDELIRFFGKNTFYTGCKISSKLWVGDYHARDLSEYVLIAEGIKRMGALRLDVDNLGDAFTAGFTKVDMKYNTIGRTATLSRKLSMFFKHYINGILQDENSEVSIIYSGGDDVFLIGAWWDVILAARKINKDFSKYSLGKLTMSAGIGIFPDKYPIHRIAKLTGDLEDVAKQKGKDRVTLFDEHLCFTWKAFDEVLDKMDEFSINITEHEKGTSFVYKLLSLVRTEDDRQINLARFVYLLSSHAPTDNSAAKERYASFVSRMYNWVQNDAQRRELIAAMYLYIYKNRKEARDEAASVQA